MKLLTLEQCVAAAHKVVDQMQARGIAVYKGKAKGKLYYIPTGGERAAQLIAMVLEDRGLRLIADVVVDDISCSGKTMQEMKEAIGDRMFTAVLVLRHTSACIPDFFGIVHSGDEYVLFPWEVCSIEIHAISK